MRSFRISIIGSIITVVVADGPIMSKQRPNRRRFLERTTVFVGGVSIAGCLTDSADDDIGNQSSAGRTESPVETETSNETESNRSSSDNTTESEETREANAERPQTVSFEAPHGTTIEGTLYGSGDCGVIMVPQINMDRESWEPQATMIADMGHRALAIDEDPDDRSSSVRGAIRYLSEQQNVSTRILLGASSGGEAVVVANASTDADTVDGTITLSAAGGVDHAPDLRGRSLFVVSESDDDRFVRVARELHEGAPEPKRLVEYEGSSHGQRLFTSNRKDALRDRIQTFLSEVCNN